MVGRITEVKLPFYQVKEAGGPEMGPSFCETLCGEGALRCCPAFHTGSTEEVESGDQFQAGFCLAPLIHEPARRGAGECLPALKLSS